MVVIQFLEDLLHYRLPVQSSLRAHTELRTILLNGSHLAVIQIYDLPMLPHQRSLLFLQIFRVHPFQAFLLLSRHNDDRLNG